MNLKTWCIYRPCSNVLIFIGQKWQKGKNTEFGEYKKAICFGHKRDFVYFDHIFGIYWTKEIFDRYTLVKRHISPIFIGQKTYFTYVYWSKEIFDRYLLVKRDIWPIFIGQKRPRLTKANDCQILVVCMYDFTSVCMTLHVYVWLCMCMYDSICVCVTLYMYVWLYMCMYDFACVCMTLPVYMHDSICVCMTLHVHVWLYICMTLYVYVWLYMCMYDSACVCMTLHVYVRL
jgi:hypothetical protein